MRSQLRSEELSIIEAAAAYSMSESAIDPTSDDFEFSREFEMLMALFELSEAYRACLAAALREGQWRQSAEPMSAIKRAVLSARFRRVRETRSPGIVFGFSEVEMALASLRDSEPDAIKGPDGVWRSGRGLNPHGLAERQCTLPISFRLREQRGRPIDWKMMCESLEKAGLDELEMAFVVGYLGKKRARAKFVDDMGADGKDRKAAQAAVKRVQRKMPRIRRFLGGE